MAWHLRQSLPARIRLKIRAHLESVVEVEEP